MNVDGIGAIVVGGSHGLGAMIARALGDAGADVSTREGTKEYVQDRMIKDEERVAELLEDPNTHVYICGLRGMEEGVEKAFTNIAESIGQQWVALRDVMREEGRYHVETY